jgi:transmembrane sensor
MRERILELLARKMAGEATEIELNELQEFISMYPDAVYYEEFLKQLWVPPAKDEVDVDKIYRAHKVKFAEHFEFTRDEDKIGRFRKYESAISIFCGLVIVSIIGFLFFLDTNKKDNAGSGTQTPPVVNLQKNYVESFNTHITAGKGMRKKIKLPDGTIVWLNSDSRLSYDMYMNQKEQRSVMLTGEASFDVKHDKKHPFIVHTDKIAVKVLGTAFNIKAYPEDKKSITTLLRGSIELSVNSRPQQKIILSPAEKFTLIENKKEAADLNGITQTINDIKDITLVLANVNPVKIGNKEYIEETSWTENRLIFQNETFEDIVPKLERWFNVQIHLKEQKLKDHRFTGVFTKENIQQALAAMQLIKSFNYKINEHDVIIY